MVGGNDWWGNVVNLAPMTAAAAAAAAAADKEHVCTPCMMHARWHAGRPAGRAANAHRYLELIRLSSLPQNHTLVGAGRSHRRAFYRQRRARHGLQRAVEVPLTESRLHDAGSNTRTRCGTVTVAYIIFDVTACHAARHQKSPPIRI